MLGNNTIVRRIIHIVWSNDQFGLNQAYTVRTYQTIISFNKKDVSNIFIELQYI